MASVPIKDRKFDTQVQYLKYKVLREVARYAFEDRLLDAYTEIPKLIVKEKPTMRCCIYKERAIVEERIKLAMGGDKNNPNVIEVIDIACDECPMSTATTVSDACRGCIAHRCKDACRLGGHHHRRAPACPHRPRSKCVECGQLRQGLPLQRHCRTRCAPARTRCKIKAISMDETAARPTSTTRSASPAAPASTSAPLAPLSDKSYILDVDRDDQRSDHNDNYKLYAVIAPVHLQPVQPTRRSARSSPASRS